MRTSNWDFVTAAYVVTWVAVVGYWIFVHRALRNSRARFDAAVAAARARMNAP